MKNRMIYQMKNKVRNLTYFLLLIGGTALTQSCSYLDVVPDKIGTIDNSFTNRNEAEKYLNTCYSYIPGNDSPYNNVALMGADNSGVITLLLRTTTLALGRLHWDVRMSMTLYVTCGMYITVASVIATSFWRTYQT